MNTLATGNFEHTFKNAAFESVFDANFYGWLGPYPSYVNCTFHIRPLKFIKISYLGHFLFTKMFTKIQNLTKGIFGDKIKFNISILKNTFEAFVDEFNLPGSVTWLLFHHIFRSIQY